MIQELLLHRHQLSLHKQIPFDELKSFTPTALLGLSLEEDLGLNYRYALPNKIFDYIQARIPILVSDLPEMRRIVESYNIGEILNERKPEELASQINKFLENLHLNNLLAMNLEKAAQELCWENEQNIMLRHFIN